MIPSRLTSALKKQFPEDFLWGASTSAHQVEGGTYNQWTKWELETAARSAAEAESRWDWLPIWKDVREAAADPHNYVSGDGVDHYRRYKEDFAILKSLGMNSFRFSIEWSRIEPEEGTYNLPALQHYKEYVKTLRDMGIEPLPNLWHWTVPVWFEEKGGFRKRSNLVYWQRFVEKVADELDWADVKYLTTLNEVNTYVGMTHVAAEFPPQKKSFFTAMLVYRNLASAHKTAYRIMKRRHPHLSLGIVHQINKIVPKDASKFLDRCNAWLYWYQSSGWFMARINASLDFIGLNYYFVDYRSGRDTIVSSNPKEPLNDLGWYMEPAGIKDALLDAAQRYSKPILITENGVADMHDSFRMWWIAETIHAIADARRAGAEVIGYLHWSLLDNFEWQYGWFPKFGLVSVDRATMKRTVKASAKTYAKWLKQD